jgi:hypothetical protein
MISKRPEKHANRIRAARTFLYKPPISYRAGIEPKQSVYYWWFEFLRRNDQYKRCCESGGKGRLATLYKDFGNVHAGSFRRWWDTDQRGERLFAEPPAPIRLQELRDADEWDEEWTRTGVMVVVVPLTEPKRRIKRWFGRVLDMRHTGRPGYPTKEPAALYQVHQKFSVLALEQMLMVWDYKQDHPDLTMAEIGRNLKLVPTAMPKVGDSLPLLVKKRNRLTATVSRYLKKAEAMIHNTAQGKFPCVD